MKTSLFATLATPITVSGAEQFAFPFITFFWQILASYVMSMIRNQNWCLWAALPGFGKTPPSLLLYSEYPNTNIIMLQCNLLSSLVFYILYLCPPQIGRECFTNFDVWCLPWQPKSPGNCFPSFLLQSQLLCTLHYLLNI